MDSDQRAEIARQLAGRRDLTRGTFKLDDKRDVCFRIARRAVEWYSHYNYINYFQDIISRTSSASASPDTQHQTSSCTGGESYLERLQRHLRRRPRWSAPIIPLHLVVVVWTLLNIVCQYNYDIQSFRLAEFLDSAGGQVEAGQPPDDQTNRTSGEATIVPQRPGAREPVGPPPPAMIGAAATSTRASLERRVEEARSSLESVGALLEEAHFSIQVILLWLMAVSLMVYFQAIYQFGFRANLNFNLARLLLDSRREREEHSQLIRRMVLNFLGSSENYLRLVLVQVAAVARCQPPRVNFDELKRAPSRQLVEAGHTRLVRQLVSMTLSGHFEPLEWSARKEANAGSKPLGNKANNDDDDDLFMVQLCKQFAYFIVLIALGCLVHIYLAVDVLRVAYGEIKLARLMDKLFCAVSAILFLNAALSVVYFVAVSLFNFSQQIKAFQLLIARTGACLRANSLRLARIVDLCGGAAPAPTAGDPLSPLSCCPKSSDNQQQHPCRRRAIIEQHKSAMNCQLLSCFLHFKLFGLQFKRHRLGARAIVASATLLLFLLPTLTWLHMPYSRSENIKLVATAFCLYQLLLFNSICFPVCYLHSKSLRHYRRLNSLFAHTVEASKLASSSSTVGPACRRCRGSPSDDDDGGGGTPLVQQPIYDRHLVWLLRKELEHPDKLTQQFAICCFGLRFTYAQLVRIHFWYGFGMLNILNRFNASYRSVYGTFYQ